MVCFMLYGVLKYGDMHIAYLRSRFGSERETLSLGAVSQLPRDQTATKNKTVIRAHPFHNHCIETPFPDGF